MTHSVAKTAAEFVNGSRKLPHPSVEKTPTFTRQHFEFIADALKTARAGLARADAPGLRLIEWDAFFIPAIADALAQTNPQFDRQRFIEACNAVPETF